MARLDKYRVISGQLFSFKHDGTVQSGDAVVVVAPGVVGRGSANDVPLGKAVVVEGNMVTVQMDGLMVLSYAGSPGTMTGLQEIVAVGDGTVQVGTGGLKVYVVDVDTSTNEIAIQL